MRVLLVDDDMDILKVLSLGLASNGSFTVETASSAIQGLEKIAHADRPFDLFLLDIQMPKMTGVELCRRIRSLPDYRYAPIIMVTAMSDKKHVDDAFAAGATDYVNKPVDFDDLQLRIKHALQSSARVERLDTTSQYMAKAVALSDAITIDDVDGVLKVHSFENYLTHLGRLKFRATKLQILTVTNIASIYERCTSQEFIDEVTDIAECISDALCDHAPMITYFGRGIFGIATHGHYVDSIVNVSDNIRRQILETGLVFRDGSPVHVEFDVIGIGRKTFLSPHTQVAFVDRMIGELKTAAQSDEPLFQ
ncbi:MULTISPECIES: response regulator [unclassified Ruegeria]|uniref:response regulator n=1 Tax=unclassified Ruegeria TaxID=2625375 RepID=UPI001ADCAF36|nr:MULTISPECIES: response regulator [unclassified Ruegeria]MBO9410707.1 response regulator [Ruegeria sp. R8_1]MBO9414908.1 response regulator [Ruegeria sp. R8_2]